MSAGFGCRLSMKCSVLLPVYNAGAALPAAIESILNQDEADFEFLIIDDCSTDDSANVIRRYAASDARIRPLFHDRNAGLPVTLNEGIAAARSGLVVRMDQDDVAMRNRIGAQVEFMQRHPEVAVAGSFVYHMGRRPADDCLVTVPTGHDEIVRTLERKNCIYHSSTILRRDAILGLGGYRVEFWNSEDYDLWLRAAKVHQLANIPEPLLRYRLSVKGMTFSRQWQQELYASMALLSSRDPGRSIDDIRREAEAQLKVLGEEWLLDRLARGSIEELIGLRLFEDAFRVLLTFSRRLGPRRAVPLVRQFGRAMLRANFRGGGKAQ